MKKTIIIAEAGVNHNGSIELAKKLIDSAAQAGADYVKFQTFKTELTISKHAEKAKYQQKNTGNNETQFEMVKKLELGFEQFKELKKYSEKKGIKFLSTGFDLPSIEFLNSLNLDVFKIPSGEITNLPYLQLIGKYNKPIYLSTGMSNLGEIEDAINILVKSGTERNKISILHANTEYPTPFEDVNLKILATLKQAFELPIGYSDHTPGIEVPIAAVALGAEIIEKHFTLDKTMEGPDHVASLEPHELKAMVLAIRNIENAIGNGIKQASDSEIKNKPIARKSIVASCNIKKGEVFTENNITVKRPGNGISPLRWNDIIGKKALSDFEEDDLIMI
jgi:N,N'-diacetyllegionaminate synthase